LRDFHFIFILLFRFSFSVNLKKLIEKGKPKTLITKRVGKLRNKKMKKIINLGNLFFSTITSKLYGQEQEAIFETKKAELRAELKAQQIHGSWEWLFLPFLEEKWLPTKKEAIFGLLKKINIPLKLKGMRIIPHDAMGHYGPDQVNFMAKILSMISPNEGYIHITAEILNEFGRNIFYIKPKGEEPKMFCKFYCDRAEIFITKLVAEEKKFETNIPFDWEKLEEMKKFFSEATIKDAGEKNTFFNTGEPCLYLNHPSFKDATGIKGDVSRSFLKKFSKSYEAKGESEYVFFSHHYGGESLPNFRLWSERKNYNESGEPKRRRNVKKAEN